MHRAALLALSLLACKNPPADPPPGPQAPPQSALPKKLSAAESRLVLRGDGEFAATLHGLIRGQSGNLVYSPASIRIALAMAAAGARGPTAEELDRVLELGPNPDDASAAFAALLTDWGQPAVKETLRVVDTLWAEEGLAFEPTFLGVLADHFGAPLQTLNFAKNPDEARGTINAAIARQTEEHIKDLVPAGALGKDTRLVLTNAVYFKSQWMTPFASSATAAAPFKLDAEKSVEVPMMHGALRASYAEGEGFQLLELGYASGRTALLLVLPTAVDGLGKLEEGLNGDRLASWRIQVRPAVVDVTLPRVELRSTLRLTDALRKVMPTPFDKDKADFTGIAAKPPLFISDVLHQGWVKIDEKGTEAAAATAVVVAAGTGAPPKAPPKRFVADHPFLFLVTDKRNGTILFLGRVADPRS